MTLATLSSGHHDLADWLLLAAFIVFVIGLAINLVGGTVATKFNPLNWVIAGLALLALALFVT